MQTQQYSDLYENLLQRREELKFIIVSQEKYLEHQLAPDESGEAQSDMNHPADLTEKDTDYEKQISLIWRQRAELAMVSDALARYEQGRYGKCVDCEIEIPYARLKAIPFTKYCITCQETHDQEGHPPGKNPHLFENNPRNSGGMQI